MESDKNNLNDEKNEEQDMDFFNNLFFVDKEIEDRDSNHSKVSSDEEYIEINTEINNLIKGMENLNNKDDNSLDKDEINLADQNSGDHEKNSSFIEDCKRKQSTGSTNIFNSSFDSNNSFHSYNSAKLPKASGIIHNPNDNMNNNNLNNNQYDVNIKYSSFSPLRKIVPKSRFSDKDLVKHIAIPGEDIQNNQNICQKPGLECGIRRKQQRFSSFRTNQNLGTQINQPTQINQIIQGQILPNQNMQAQAQLSANNQMQINIIQNQNLQMQNKMNIINPSPNVQVPSQIMNNPQKIYNNEVPLQGFQNQPQQMIQPVIVNSPQIILNNANNFPNQINKNYSSINQVNSQPQIIGQMNIGMPIVNQSVQSLNQPMIITNNICQQVNPVIQNIGQINNFNNSNIGNMSPNINNNFNNPNIGSMSPNINNNFNNPNIGYMSPKLHSMPNNRNPLSPIINTNMILNNANSNFNINNPNMDNTANDIYLQQQNVCNNSTVFTHSFLSDNSPQVRKYYSPQVPKKSPKGKCLDIPRNRINLENILRQKDKRTTLMIRHIPNKYSLKLFSDEINKYHMNKYDLLYLPMDSENKCNLGYGFINFVNPMHIISFYDTYNLKKWQKFNSEKICELAYAKIQGKNELLKHIKDNGEQNKAGLEIYLVNENSSLCPNQIILPMKFFQLFINFYPYSLYKIINSEFFVVEKFYNF